MDSDREKEIVELWHLQQIEDAEMDIEDLEELIINGFQDCGIQDCKSAYISGEDSCRCIRSVFPHPQHYETYRELRELKLKTECLLDLMRIGEDLEQTRNTTESEAVG